MPSNVNPEQTVEYYYSVNEFPTLSSSKTTATAIGPGPFARHSGDNTLYVFAKQGTLYDTTNFATVTFTADIANPDPPNAATVSASDISNKNEEVDPTGNSGDYRIVVSWTDPISLDKNNFDHYNVYASKTPENIGSFTKVGETSGDAYVHLKLDKDSTYYYYVTTVDNINNESVPSTTTASLMAHDTASGKYKFPPNINENNDCNKSGSNCDIGKKVLYTVGARTATIKWNTNRNARPEVQYGIAPDQLTKTAAVSISSASSSHEVPINNLNPETKYYYRVVFTDQDGNSGYYPAEGEAPLNFTTTPSPKVSTLKIDSITLSSMFITWQSSVASHGSVIYRKSTDSPKDQKEIEESANNYSTDHSAQLKELAWGTTYIFQIKATDTEGNLFESDEYTENTLPMPKINDDLKAENKKEVDSPTIIVTYTTNVAITTVIKYSANGGASKTYIDLEKKTEHQAEISGLAPKAPYVLEIVGTDDYGNEAAPKTFQITTESDTMPPKIVSQAEKKRVIGDGANAEAQLTVKLTSNEPTTMVVEATQGVGSDKFDIVSNEDPLNTEHTVPLKLKQAGMTYSYHVVIKDAAGNITTSEVRTVVIEKANKTAFEYTLSIFSRSFGWLSKILKPGN